jgi:hypothetical protein
MNFILIFYTILNKTTVVKTEIDKLHLNLEVTTVRKNGFSEIFVWSCLFCGYIVRAPEE